MFVRVKQGISVCCEEALGRLWGFLGRQEDIEDQTEGIFEEFRNYAAKKSAANLKRRVCIDLTQPRFSKLVHQEIQTIDLKIQSFASPDYPRISNGMCDIPCHLLHFGQYFLVKVESGLIEAVLIELTIGKLIGRLEAIIIGHVLLHGIVGEMDAS